MSETAQMGIVRRVRASLNSPATAMCEAGLKNRGNLKLWECCDAGTLPVSWGKHRIAKHCVQQSV